MKVKVAVLQYVVPEDADSPFTKLDEMVGNAVWSGAKLVVAPEAAVGNVKELDAKKDHLSRLCKLAQKHAVFLATSLYSSEKGEIYNQGHIISPEGKPVLSHKKIYIADCDKNKAPVKKGNKLEVVDTRIGKLAMLICKDGFTKYSHFLYDRLNKLGAEIICIPSKSVGVKEVDLGEYSKANFVYGSFTSRAFVLISNIASSSSHPHIGSMIISPDIGVVKEAVVGRKEILSEELDLNDVTRTREFDSHWQPDKKDGV